MLMMRCGENGGFSRSSLDSRKSLKSSEQWDWPKVFKQEFVMWEAGSKHLVQSDSEMQMKLRIELCILLQAWKSKNIFL